MLCFVREEQVLMGKLGGHEVRIAMAGPKAKVSVHCNRLAEGKLSVRDLNRNSIFPRFNITDNGANIPCLV